VDCNAEGGNPEVRNIYSAFKVGNSFNVEDDYKVGNMSNGFKAANVSNDFKAANVSNDFKSANVPNDVKATNIVRQLDYLSARASAQLDRSDK
jgi:hypothetical protein